MINDNYKDLLYLSELLPIKHPTFFKSLTKALLENKISFKLIPNTNDIWARDYMPIQNSAGEFIQYKYSPDYLDDKKYTKSITNVSKACRSIDIKCIKSNIVLDGGNVVHYGNKVVMCDKILKENPKIPESTLINQIKKLFRVKHVLLIPTQSSDIFGHSDGVLRFKNSNTVLVNDFSKDDPKYWKQLLDKLKTYKLKVIKVPCFSEENKTNIDATGFYINYLQIKNVIFLPAFNKVQDQKVEKLFKKVFPKYKIILIDSSSIAKKGGLLNCISWTIKSNYPTKLSAFEREVNRDILNLGLEELYLDDKIPSAYSNEALEKIAKLKTN